MLFEVYNLLGLPFFSPSLVRFDFEPSSVRLSVGFFAALVRWRIFLTLIR